MSKQKYIRLERYNEIIIFPGTIEHSAFSHFKPISAGFCYINSEKEEVSCFGESFSLQVKSHEDDSKIATKQIFGDGYY